MKSNTKTCGDCGKVLPHSAFYQSSLIADGFRCYCKECEKAYRREYILPALRGRGKARVMPDWVMSMLDKPKVIERKVIRLEEYIDKDRGNEVHAVLKVAGKKS
jgi:hypothetical protein